VEDRAAGLLQMMRLMLLCCSLRRNSLH
jgi:hypothetical protein